MENLLKKYNLDINEREIHDEVKHITSNISSLYNIANLKRIFSLIDLTTLSTEDTQTKAKLFADNVSNFKEKFPEMPNVAAICVYPTLVETVRKNLKAENVNIASVVGGFPSSQTFLNIKETETKAAIKAGADEADMVISVGEFLEGNYQVTFDEVKTLKKAVGKGHLKVILESGLLQNLKNVKTASILSMEAGCDFIKTSTGKTSPAATLDAVYIMAEAIKEYYEKTGKKIGLKPAGGISDSETAVKYFAIMKNVLGEEWLTPEFFRIGASSLANNILTDISRMSSDNKAEVKYF